MQIVRFLVTFALLATIGCSSTRVDLAAMNEWDIVVAEDAIPSERSAAEEFQEFCAQATGARLPIVSAVDRPDRHVFIGPGSDMRESSAGFDTTGMGDEGLRIVVRGGNIAIAGGRPRGTLYGVYTFLEDYLGIRFLTAEVTHVPKADSPLDIGRVDRSYEPPFSYRFYLKQELMFHPEFAVRRRQNTAGRNAREERRLTERLGGEAIGGVYLHNNFLFPGSFDTNPEHYCLYEGKRQALQPCLSHPYVREAVVERVLGELSSYPEGDTITLAQNDAPGACQCSRCAEVLREGDAPEDIPVPDRNPLGMGFIPSNGPPSAVIVDFVNHVAAHVAKERPDLFVGTEAYAWSMMPPRKTRTLPNVRVQLAMYHACVMHAFEDPDCPENAKVVPYLDGWGRLCENLLFWHYDLNPRDYLFPAPNLRALGPQMKSFERNGGQAIFLQGPARNTEFSDLRAYLTSSLIWNPSIDADELIDEFLGLYYGKAAEPIRRWIDLVHDQALASGRHTNINFTPKSCGLDADLGRKGLELFEEAMELADDEEIRDRVEKVSVTALRLAVEPVFWNAIEAPRRVVILEDTTLEKELMHLEPGEKERLRPQVRRLFELCGKHGINEYMEGAYTKVAVKALREYYGLAEDEML